MRLYHFSDTHLGHGQYPRTNADGLNAREQDLYDAFHHVIDRAVSERPDLVVHAGDLFDGVRPGNRALACAMEGFLKLSRAGIPTVLIAGNHEHPRLRETGSPMRLFSHLPGMHVAYQGLRQAIDLDAPGGRLRVHLVPQCSDNAALATAIAEAGQEALNDPRTHHLLVVHGAVRGIPAFAHAEFNEQSLDPAWFAPFSYVALGHYHGMQQVAANAWYCGAPERVSIAEASQVKGFLRVELPPQPGTPANASFAPVPGRMYQDLDAIDCTSLDAAACKEAALAALARTPPHAVVRLRLSHLATSLRGALDLRSIRAAGEHLLHLDLRPEWSDTALSVQGGGEFRGLSTEFTEFAARQEIGDRAAVLAAAREVLS